MAPARISGTPVRSAGTPARALPKGGASPAAHAGPCGPAGAPAADVALPAAAPPHGPGDEPPEGVSVARRARWVAAGTGALLTLAGLGASLLRLAGSAPARIPAAYAVGAVLCACAAALGHRGRTRRALWLLIAGVMVMALGDEPA
nr:hypothetical protein StreXyl84_19450 [Streptomyces sp. Xyl84]